MGYHAVIVGIVLFLVHFASPRINSLGNTPPMGWNSWNHYACNINEEIVRKTADIMVSSGLAKLGYTYVNVDDCWQKTRNKQGKIQEDPLTFPSGMKTLADYVHSKGLKFGLYSDAGYLTCEGKPGSLGFEELDAQSYADWGVDYLKYDNCFTDNSSPKIRYPKMRDALLKQSREIFFSMCEWGVEDPASWAEEVGNSWRTTQDIVDNWDSFLDILDQQYGLEKHAGHGHWNDPDMLEVGNGGMTDSEYQAHFALWALLKSPMLLGCDLSKMSEDTWKIISNEEVIAISQDPLGIQGKRIQREEKSTGYLEVYAGEIKDAVAIILLNRSQKREPITVHFKDTGFHSSGGVLKDLVTKKEHGFVSSSYTEEVDPRSSVVLRLNYCNECQEAIGDY